MNIITIKNVNGYVENNIAYLKLEDVARGLGFVDTSKGTNKIIWSRVDKYLADITATQVSPFDRTGFIPENIFYKLCMKANNEVARRFQDLVCDEILPSIRKTGQYKVKQIDPDKEERARKRLEIMEKNARVRESKQFSKLAEMTKDGRYKESLIAISANTLAKQEILPLPRIEQESYTAGEIGKILGISANLVGRIANEHGIKSDRYGYLAQDKAKYANKAVESFRYYAHAIDEFRKYL